MGIYSEKENLFIEFRELKTKPKKVAWLKDLLGITAREEAERAAEKAKQGGGKTVFSGRGPNAK